MASTTVVFLLCALVIACQGEGGLFKLPAGPFELKLTQIGTCPDEGTRQIRIRTKINSVGNGKYIYNSPIYLGVPFDENTQTHAEILQWGNGGYKRFYELTIKDCEHMKSMVGKYVEESLRATWAPGVIINKCPVPKGNYTVRNLELNLDLDFLPAMIYGSYKGIFTNFYKGVKVGCVMVLADFVPKTTN